MNTRLLLQPAGCGKTFTIKKEIIGTLIDTTDNVITIQSSVFGKYNEYEFLINKNRGIVISPINGINKDINPRFISYDIFMERDGLNFERYFVMALSDAFHRVINNSKNNIKTHIYIDEIGMYFIKNGVFEMIADFIEACKDYNCVITIASQCKEEVERYFKPAV